MGGVTVRSKGEKVPEGDAAAGAPSGRQQEIARSHEEMLGLLRDLPESDYELSLTDLVERRPAAADGESVTAAEKTAAAEAAGTTDAAKKKRREWRSGSERKAGAEGVLLNMYVPCSLTRSLTTGTGSRLRRGSSKRGDSSKRDREPPVKGCWLAIWERGGRGKARRQRTVQRE